MPPTKTNTACLLKINPLQGRHFTQGVEKNARITSIRAFQRSRRFSNGSVCFMNSYLNACLAPAEKHHGYTFHTCFCVMSVTFRAWESCTPPSTILLFVRRKIYDFFQAKTVQHWNHLRLWLKHFLGIKYIVAYNFNIYIIAINKMKFHTISFTTSKMY